MWKVLVLPPRGGFELHSAAFGSQNILYYLALNLRVLCSRALTIRIAKGRA